MVEAVETVAQRVDRLEREYQAAVEAFGAATA